MEQMMKIPETKKKRSIKSSDKTTNNNEDNHSRSFPTISEETEIKDTEENVEIINLVSEIKIEETDDKVDDKQLIDEAINEPKDKPEVILNDSTTNQSQIEQTVTNQIKTENKFDNLLKINQEIASTIKLEQMNETFLNIEKTIRPPKQLQQTKPLTIKPYTESQLAALYTNTELEMLDTFTSQYIEVELRGLAIKQHPLYDLLSNYLSVREKIKVNSIELDQLKTEYSDLISKLWTLDTAKVTGRGECADGVVVTANHTYQKAIFHRSIFKSVNRVLGAIRKLVYENYVLYSYSAEDLRLQIELYLQTTIANCLNVTKLDSKGPVILSLENEPLHLKPYLSEIRLCISILFAFQRKLIKDPQFTKETRNWLSRLIAVLLRLATYQDHLFILSHVLRCPAGMASWASNFIQTPLDLNLDESPFSSYQVNHILAILNCLLSPIKERERFLEEIVQSRDNNGDSLWIMVDSEGEEDDESGNSLRENDLVALLTQLPLENLFRGLLLVGRKDFQNCYDSMKVTESHILRFFAFSTVFLRIINKGLGTYNQSRYIQFSKRLSRLIRHIVQYGTDQWEQFQKVQKSVDKAMMERLQIEYDAFFLRAIYYLYTSQKLGGWQFLAVVPYNLIQIKAIWKIYYFLHNSDHFAKDILNPSDVNVDYNLKLWEKQLREKFEEKLESLADDELYYLMNTFANMALARNSEDKSFIEAATIDLLQIGFISQTTQEICSKTARTLLTHLTSKHPHLLSNILKYIRDNVDQISPSVLYLYEELPLSVWKMSDDDLEIISRLLISSPSGNDGTKLARMILSRLNWDILPYEIHCNVAILVLEAIDREPNYIQWGWQTIFRLKLHISDQHFSNLNQINEPERFDIIMKGLREQQPLASFVAILLTTWGHLIPLICNQGMSQMLFLQFHQKHEAVLFCLYLIVPLFTNCQEQLINFEKFQEILLNLINADRGYISMAKSLISTQNTVLQQFGNMIETQIVNFTKYNLNSPRLLVRLWVNSLISISNWNKDTGIIYLIDVIIRASFFHADSLDIVYNILNEILRNSLITDQTGTISTIFKWVVSNSNNSNASLILSPLSSYPWLAYVVINIEFEVKENSTNFWNLFLKQLSLQKGKVNVDTAIKKSTNLLKLPSFTSGSLCIYRWAQQAMDTDISHPLLPILWQKFFSLYLMRVPINDMTGIDECVGDKFFDGFINFAFFKRIKKRLQETVDYYQKKLNDGDENKKEFNENCLKLFKAFALWLEEPKLQESNLLLQTLPTQYESKLLGLIIQKNTTPWYEYVDYEEIKTQQLNSIKVWKVANFRLKTNINKPLPNPNNSMESDDPIERILRRLTVYETPKLPPEIKNSAPIIPIIDFSNKETMFNSLNNCFKTFKNCAQNHTLKLSEHLALDCSYQELVPQLYRSVLVKVNKKVACKGRNHTSNCSGHCTIVLEMQEARVNDSINHQILTNRNVFENLLKQTLQTPAMNLCSASVTVQQTIKILQMQLRCNPASAELGVELFYYILSLINEETNTYLPTKTLFATLLERLGQSHICGVEYEMPGLLNRILKEPNLGEYLAPHFSPNNVGTANLLIMYLTICEKIGNKYDVSFALLSKFDIDFWLKNKKPKLSQCSEFIETVVKALTVLGYEPQIEALVLHGLYRKHLITIFEYQFPEHYGEILIKLLKASNGSSSDTSLISISVWLDVINSITKPLNINLKSSLKEQFRLYAQKQNQLQYQDLLDTIELLIRHFTDERLQYGLFGLYPKCRNYIEIFACLLGLISHAFIISTINTFEGMLNDKLCEKIWPYLRNLFTPWIVPYSMQNVQDNMASWIQQLADDRSILLPWIPADEVSAQKIINVFYECVQFMLQTLPGSSCVLSFIWQWYVNNFAHISIKEHILKPIHNTLLLLPWNNFWPSLIDLEFMLKVIDQYLPENHQFLGNIFMSVRWISWFKTLSNTPIQIKSRIYQCFINLLIKLSNEPNIRNKYKKKLTILLVESENFDWNLLELNVFVYIMDWYVFSCDSIVIFKSDPLDVDNRVLNLLKVISGYSKPVDNIPMKNDTNLQSKRVVFIKSYIKLISVFTSRYKAILPNKENELSSVILHELNHLENIVQTQEELNLLLNEILNLLNICAINHVTIKCFTQWISNKLGDSLVIKGILQCLGVSVSDCEIVGQIFELTLTTYFQNNVSTEPSWTEITKILNIVLIKQTELEQVLLDKGYILTLYTILLQRIDKCSDNETVLNISLEWLKKIKITESNESKIPLLWSGVLELALKHCEIDESSTGRLLNEFSEILLEISENKVNSGWGRGLLNVIGLNKQETMSLNFRFLCRALAGYVLAQLPGSKCEPQKVVRHEANAPNKVGQSGGNVECSKVLLNLGLGQSQGKIKDCEELALKQIQDPSNSLHNSRQFLMLLVKQFYIKPYLKNIG